MRANRKQLEWQKIDVQNRSRDELYQMELTFNEMIDHLKENYQKQEQFVSDASHEMNTPISIVKSYAQLLKRRGKERPELFDEAIDAIDSEADRMQLLVEQMLLLAKNQVETVRKNIEITELCEAVRKTFIGAYAREINMKSFDYSIVVHGNEDQLKQVIYILLDNALKYSDEKVELEISQQDKLAIIKITDFGSGISPADLKRVFDRFYRIDKARSRKTGGTGLGLSIAKAIVNNHDGKLSVSSEIEFGTTFTIYLPIVKD
jgi:signal transduction histidine kinase